MRIFLAAMFLTLSARAAEPAKVYDIQMTTEPTVLVAGSPAQLLVGIRPHDGWSLKTETPFKAMLRGSDHLKLGKSTFGAQDFRDPKATMKTVSTAITAHHAGHHKVTADITFFICSAEVCQRFQETMEHAVVAK